MSRTAGRCWAAKEGVSCGPAGRQFPKACALCLNDAGRKGYESIILRLMLLHTQSPAFLDFGPASPYDTQGDFWVIEEVR